jgi:phosphatidylglycerophosphatase A
MNSESSPPTAAPKKKPRISYFIATAFGLGYLKPGPGTWGSLGGAGIAILWTYPYWRMAKDTTKLIESGPPNSFELFVPGTIVFYYLAFIVVVAAIGVIASDRVASHSGMKDPQFVVFDEVSGQLITYFGAPYVLVNLHHFQSGPWLAILNWKCLLLGFILFRVFDIWKPFPARQAESLPGGWGIMADDWIAGIYAALGLWAARALGLLA